MMEKVEKLRADLEQIAKNHGRAALASSFGMEDMVLIDMIARHDLDIEVFTLDTGRLPEETYALMQETKRRYGLSIEVYFPKAEAVSAYVGENGPNAFYDSVELRKGCCQVRKVEPLKRALAGCGSWITGMRRQQSPTRSDLEAAAFDGDNGLMKFNPLLEWTEKEVWNYIRMFNVPYNALHDRSYPSIGCAPCTRAIAKGEDIRAGRWWWEDALAKECGLHRKKA